MDGMPCRARNAICWENLSGVQNGATKRVRPHYQAILASILPTLVTA